MPTETDLRGALRDLEQRADAHGIPDFLAALDQRAQCDVLTISPSTDPTDIARRRHRLLAPLLVAAAVAAVAAGVVGLPNGPLRHTSAGHGAATTTVPSNASSTPTSALNPPNTGGPSSGGPSTGAPSTGAPPNNPSASAPVPRALPVNEYWFTVNPIPGLKNTGGTTFAYLQQATLDSTDGKGHYDLTLNAAGTWTPAQPANAVPVTVNGHPGFYGTLKDLPMGVEVLSPTGLAWQYASGAWASVVSWDDKPISRVMATTIADAVRPAVRSPLRVPLRIGALPSGYSVQGVITTAIGGYRTGQHGFSGWASLIDLIRSGPTAANSAVSIGVSAPIPGDTPPGTRTVINGRTAYVTKNLITIEGPGFEAGLNQGLGDPAAGVPLTPGQFLALARSLSFPKDISNSRSWYDATTALG